MNEMFETFLSYVDQENKEAAVMYAISLLEEGKIDVVSLYKDILEPAMYAIDCKLEDKEMCIWMEHARSSIVRTIIECSYPYVLKEKAKKNIPSINKKVIVICPPEEQHELGARMVADFFTLNGFEALFVGANTPKEEFIKAIQYYKPDYIAISISNFYNLFNAKHVIASIREKIQEPIQILVGGQVFVQNPLAYKQIQADLYIKSYEDIKALRLEVSKNEGVL